MLTKDRRNFKQSQIKILEIKIVIYELKNTLDRINSKLDLLKGYLDYVTATRTFKNPGASSSFTLIHICNQHCRTFLLIVPVS